MESALAALCNVLNNSEEAKQALHHEATSMQLLVNCLFSSSQRVREYSVGAIWCVFVPAPVHTKRHCAALRWLSSGPRPCLDVGIAYHVPGA
jgi:hypothetical protein